MRVVFVSLASHVLCTKPAGPNIVLHFPHLLVSVFVRLHLLRVQQLRHVHCYHLILLYGST